MTGPFAASTVALMMLVGCSQAPSSGAVGQDPPTATSGPEIAPSVQDRSASDRFDAATASIRLRTVASGLASPLDVTHAGDGSGRLFVVEQDGRIRIFRKGELVRRPFLDIDPLTEGGGEQGLLGLAFHPRYETNRRFYVNYTNNDGDTVISEYRAMKKRPGRANPNSARRLMLIAQPYPNHNGGGMEFGPDGYLYIATGDGGGGGDPQDNAEDRSSLLGKILRIDVARSRAGDAEYAIPPDNPFVTEAGAAPEVWSYGLRNPFRFSFDRTTGDIWIGDVGQNELEEVDRHESGRGVNFGWDIMEGDACYEPPTGCSRDGLEMPIASYSHDHGCVVTGGHVYRGARYPDLVGAYIFADFCSGEMWVLDAAGPSPQEPEPLLSSGRAISSFGENENGEIFLTDLSAGELVRVIGES